MPAIVAYPSVVEELLGQFGDLFPNEPSRRHFAEHPTGLLVAERKTVSGISREFAQTTDQSCLNRWLTAAPFQTHTELAKGLVDWVVERAIPGDFTFDSYFTNAELLHHIHGHGRAYVGDQKANRVVTVAGKDWKVSEWIASQLGPLARTKFTVGGVTRWSFTSYTQLGNLT